MVPRLEVSEVCIAAAVAEVGTAMRAVIFTLAASTLMVTAGASTAATAEMFCFKSEDGVGKVADAASGHQCEHDRLCRGGRRLPDGWRRQGGWLRGGQRRRRVGRRR